MSNILKLIFSVSICLLLTSCDSPRKSQRVEPVVIMAERPQQEENVIYTVHEGDTVGSVAYQNNITRADLIELNDLIPPYELYSGQQLIIKRNSNPVTNNYKFELVQDGGLVTNSDYKDSNVSTISDTSNNEDISTDDEDSTLMNNNVNVSQAKEQNNKPNNEINTTSKYIWPVDKNSKNIIKHFKDTNEYTIIQAPSGTPVRAVSDGVVKFAGTSQSEGTLGYGKMVIIKHSNPSRLTLYAKLGNTSVTKGQKIKKGDKIGTIAKGKNKNSNLYFSLMNVNNKNKRTYIDPEGILN